MAGGSWSATEGKVRPGFYMNFVAAALAAIQAGSRGTVAIPVKADWGPVKSFTEIEDLATLLNTYGEDVAVGTTAYRAIFLALLGGAKKVLGYRLVDGSAAKMTKTLADTTAVTPVDVLKLDSKYETARAFKVTTRTNLVDSNKSDILLYEGTTLLYTFTYTHGTGGVANAVAAINGDTKNLWVVATSLDAGNGVLANVTASAFGSGNNGISGIANSDYITAQAAFETMKWNEFVLDCEGDSALQVSFAAWITGLRDDGWGACITFGGDATDDQTPATGNARSASFNHEGIRNVITGGTVGGVAYASFEIAPWFAGKIAGQKLTESITYATGSFTDVSPRLTNAQIITSLQSGSLCLVHDGVKVKVEQGLNTLTSLRQGQNNQWKKIRAIRTMDSINDDLLAAASDNYIGKVNNEDGKIALINAFKKYMATLAIGGVIEDNYLVYLDPDWHGGAEPLAAADSVYPVWEANITDCIEKIFGRFVVKSS